MALIKDIETPSGVAANYHIPTFIDWNKFGECIVTVSSYKDSVTRNASKLELTKKGYVVNIDMQDILTLIYSKLALEPDFINATTDEI